MSQRIERASDLSVNREAKIRRSEREKAAAAAEKNLVQPEGPFPRHDRNHQAANPRGLLMTAIDGVLLPYQSRWIADRSEVKIAEKSRRTGLTWAEAADAVLRAGAAEGGREPPLHRCGKGHWRRSSSRQPPCGPAVSIRPPERSRRSYSRTRTRDILTYVIRFASGRRIEALSSRPSGLRGRGGNVTIDEAAFSRPAYRGLEGRFSPNHVGWKSPADLDTQRSRQTRSTS